MRRTTLTLSAAVGAALPVWSAPASASFGLSAVTFDVDTGQIGTNLPQTVGWEFNVNEEITVTALQWYDDFGDGLTISHEVGIWNSAGTLLASVVVPSGTSADLFDGLWRTVKIPELVLPAIGGYVIGGYNGSNAVDHIVADVTQNVIPQITWVEVRFSSNTGEFKLPLLEIPGVFNGIYGPSFQVFVPAPGAAMLLGITFLAGRRRR